MLCIQLLPARVCALRHWCSPEPCAAVTQLCTVGMLHVQLHAETWGVQACTHAHLCGSARWSRGAEPHAHSPFVCSRALASPEIRHGPGPPEPAALCCGFPEIKMNQGDLARSIPIYPIASCSFPVASTEWRFIVGFTQLI